MSCSTPRPRRRRCCWGTTAGAQRCGGTETDTLCSNSSGASSECWNQRAVQPPPRAILAVHPLRRLPACSSVNCSAVVRGSRARHRPALSLHPGRPCILACQYRRFRGGRLPGARTGAANCAPRELPAPQIHPPRPEQPGHAGQPGRAVDRSPGPGAAARRLHGCRARPGPAPTLTTVLEASDRSVFNEDTAQPTSIDLVIGSPGAAGGLYVESKLSESEFGSCSLFASGDCEGRNPAPDLNSCYLHFIRRYWDCLQECGGLQGLATSPVCLFAVYYQFFRELLFAVGKGGSFVLLYDRHKPAFVRSGPGGERAACSVPDLAPAGAAARAHFQRHDAGRVRSNRRIRPPRRLDRRVQHANMGCRPYRGRMPCRNSTESEVEDAALTWLAEPGLHRAARPRHRPG